MIDFIRYFDDNNLVPRPEQFFALQMLEKNWDSHKYFFLDLPVGVGKTYVALAIAEQLSSSYFLTSTKLLQEQYEQHSPKIVSLMGRANYRCNVEPMFTVDAAPCLVDKKLKGKCMTTGKCDYYHQKDLALNSQMMITNYPYFLYATHCGPLSGADSEWHARDALIMDEAHELESYLISVAEIKLVFLELNEQFGIAGDDWIVQDNYDDNIKMLKLIENQISTKVAAEKRKLDQMFNFGVSPKHTAKIQKLNSKINALDKILQPLKIFFTEDDTTNWLVTPNLEENSITVSPLSAKTLFNRFLNNMADKFVFTSATLGDPKVFARELGIDESEMCIIKTDTPFDPAKSPITIIPICKMNYREIDANLPTIVAAIETIMEHHSDQKGIIHAGNYKITKAIQELTDQKNKDRLLSRDMYKGQKLHNSKLLQMHNANSDPSVLVSPSMTTGIDLYGDLSRFQIIVKLPFLSLADPRIKKKSGTDGSWYRNKMWTQVLQSTGRSVRSESDFAETYILDSSFDYFYRMDYHGLARWFRDRVEVS